MGTILVIMNAGCCQGIPYITETITMLLFNGLIYSHLGLSENFSMTMNAIDTLLRNDTPTDDAMATVSGTFGPCRGARVLVVDDSPDNLSLEASMLMQQGCEVFIADSGPRALEMVETVQPALVLLDLMMPDMDGIETCERLKALPGVHDVPVIILTAHDDDESLLRSFAAGAVDYVLKPFNPAVLLARVTTHVQLFRRTRELERLAGIDALTGLSNRRAFDQRFGDEWRRSRRSGTALGLLLLDIDWFKQYNDGKGHQQGDVALRAVANALRESTRRVDDFCGRYGGEEFVVLSACELGDDPEPLANRILDAIRGLAIPHHHGGAGPILTASIGYACVVPQGGISPTALFEAADAALYRAKDLGRDRAERGLVEALV